MKFALFAVSIIYTMIALVEASPMPQAPEVGGGGLPDLGGSLGGNAGGTLGGNAGGTGTGNLAGSANGALNGALNGGLGSALLRLARVEEETRSPLGLTPEGYQACVSFIPQALSILVSFQLT
ncbi:hypothetical protein Agabi119p4_28 [Agaricus bisporus var. burnettii]|uniref:Uncharacterized protein n=1 Tax=Agaricus bisporus var. burnettii TaxID=192524 RepID=A0A8H7KKC9_AGABI|nr:hypothetical protein Agabi119p4_28 [Agaricus bisporus var. burnettii]